MDYETDARFQCPRCEQEVHTNVSLPEPWTEKGSGKPHVEIISVTCPFCEEEFGTNAYIEPWACSLEFIDHPLAVIAASSPKVRDESGWDDYEPPEDPYSIFNTSLHGASVLLDEKGGDGSHLMNRMVFAHFIGAFEAFLADTLINQVLTSPNALKRLIERDSSLRARRFSLSEISSNPDLIPDTVRSRLRAEMWHNIPKASALYRVSFDIDILGMLGKDNPTIEKAIEYRHDCVHRNGYDKEGEKLEVFTKDYINNVGGILSNVALAILSAFDQITAAAFFVSDKKPPETPI